MNTLKNLIIFFLFSAICFSNVAAQESRGVKRVYRDGNTERRTALVIGNGNYKASPLRNPCNDAQDIGSILQQKNFQVTLLLDADKRQMVDAIRQFGKDLKKGGVGLFYYAGHGMQMKGSNYLIPVGANIEAEHEIPLESVDVNRILGFMEDAENRLNMIILDACRDNPFSRSFRSSAKGLAQLDAPVGTLIAYATSPGRTAADGVGRNGIYTKHLLEQMNVPKLEVGQMFRKVRTGVRKETEGKQVSWESVSIEGSFYFTDTSSNLEEDNDNFSSRQVVFTLPNNTLWEKTSNKYIATGEMDTFAWSKETYEGDFVLEAEIESNDEKGEGAIVVYGNGKGWEKGCLIFNISSEFQSIRAHTVYEGVEFLSESSTKMEFRDKTYKMAIKVKDRKASLYIDGKKHLSTFLPDDINRKGKIGLFKYWGRPSVTFSDITIK